MNESEIPQGLQEEGLKKADQIPYLPIGSVVLLKGGRKRVMVYGRKVRDVNGGDVYDYLACLYPEGALSSQNVIVFNQDQIQMVYFIGFQDVEELAFRSRLRESKEE